MKNGTPHIALIEDDPTMRRALERLLCAYGYVSESYLSAEAFLGREEKSRVDCLLLDIGLGGMSGIELSRKIIADGATPPVVFISAQDDNATIEDAVHTDCLAFLHKPFESYVLIGVLEAVMKSA